MVDTNNKYFYEYGDNEEAKEKTRRRLTQISELGMEEVGNAEFGIRGIMSGLYIEKIWSFSDQLWDDYIRWVQELINSKTN